VYVALPWDGNWAVAPVAPAALKVETRALARSHLKTELKVLAKVQGLPGFPRVFDSGQLHRTMWMAMELLGPSLRSLFDKYQIFFSRRRGSHGIPNQCCQSREEAEET